MRTNLELHSKKQAGFVWKTKDNYHGEMRKLQIRKPQGKKILLSQPGPRISLQRAQGYTHQRPEIHVGKRQGKDGYLLRANTFVENCNQLL